MGTSRQNADLDAHAAYLNALRWYISGDVTYANKALSILNAWSAAVNQVPTGADTPGLIGIPIMDFATWSANTNPQYVDSAVTNGTTYYYVVAAINQSGTSANSAQASATPLAAGSLPVGWTNQDVGTVTTSGSASYSSVGDGTFVTNGQGGGIGGTSDTGYNY